MVEGTDESWNWVPPSLSGPLCRLRWETHRRSCSGWHLLARGDKLGPVPPWLARASTGPPTQPLEGCLRCPNSCNSVSVLASHSQTQLKQLEPHSWTQTHRHSARAHGCEVAYRHMGSDQLPRTHILSRKWPREHRCTFMTRTAISCLPLSPPLPNAQSC